jgi:hypothetical protein
VVEQFFGKTTSLPKRAPYLMPQSTIIPFYSRLMIVPRKRRDKAVPIISRYPVVAYSHLFYLLSQFFGRFQIPFPPYLCHDFPAFTRQS